jgi:hypothetical protein
MSLFVGSSICGALEVFSTIGASTDGAVLKVSPPEGTSTHGATTGDA